MILISIGFFILFITISFILYKIVPELKIFLTKDRHIQHINNITVPGAVTIEKQESVKIEQEEKKEIPVEEKMTNIFLNPTFKEIKKNFDNLGEVKKSKKSINEDIEKLKEFHGNN